MASCDFWLFPKQKKTMKGPNLSHKKTQCKKKLWSSWTPAMHSRMKGTLGEMCSVLRRVIRVSGLQVSSLILGPQCEIHFWKSLLQHYKYSCELCLVCGNFYITLHTLLRDLWNSVNNIIYTATRIVELCGKKIIYAATRRMWFVICRVYFTTIARNNWGSWNQVWKTQTERTRSWSPRENSPKRLQKSWNIKFGWWS